MQRQRLLWQLYPSYVFITLGSLLAAGWFTSHSVARFFRDSVGRTLQVRAQFVDRVLGDQVPLVVDDHVRRTCRLTREVTETRLTLLDPSGQILYDTDFTGSAQEGAFPEVRAALAGEVGEARRYDPVTQLETEYIAIPALRGGEIVGVIRASMPITSIAQDLSTIQWQVAIGAVAIAALAALIGLVVSQRIARPLEEMRHGAEAFARGNLSHRLEVPATAELGRLAETLNDMAQQLEERIRSMARQSNEQRAVLASMVEGVLAVDMQQRIISLNRAAAELLGYSQIQAAGRTLQEVIRNADLRRFAGQALASDDLISGDITMHGEGERVLEAHGTALREAGGQTIGAVIVLNDVSDYRRLENMRRDFVANVSHELKTPITSIKGFVETLLDGAIEHREDAERFLRIIAKQADRLHSIIDDLLSLSRIEQSEGAEDIPLELSRLRQVLDSAVHDCQPRADERRIEISITCDELLQAKINSPLLEQALLNLLDNAIKYSEDGGRIEVRAATQGGNVVISIRDNGCGIPPEHLSRIFERFYRVDKARSRKLGGTGLGLSIVKHIVNVHRGRVTVESTPSRGSTFSIHLPAEPVGSLLVKS